MPVTTIAVSAPSKITVWPGQEITDSNAGSGTINYITVDQLNTPRVVTNSAGTVIWSWAYAGNPFGEQRPTSMNDYVLNLRYPGQYYDAETNTNYNMFRNYEPATGRYLQSDPIGLLGGVSTYAYVGSNPLSHTDSTGLAVGDKYATVDRAGVAAVTDVLVDSVTQNREYAGVIYRNWDGSYSYTEANPGTEVYARPGDAPWLHDESGIYHTHGQASPAKDTEHFSRPGPDGIGDTGLSDELGVPNYVGTPHFAIKKIRPLHKNCNNTPASSSAVRLHSSALLVLLPIVGILCVTSCARGDPQKVERIPALALKGGGAIYSSFTAYLNKGPRDNGFTKFASSPENFTVSITDRGDRFVYTFILKPYRGGAVLGGPISFSWSKKDGKIERTLRP